MRVAPFVSAAMLVAVSVLAGCGNGGGGEEAAVESGTYQGAIQQVKPGEREIYVETEDGQVLELYFTDQTTLQQNGQSAEFTALSKGQQVEVEVEAEDGELTPLSVTIMGGDNGGEG
jgi:major membrane immunogen (membrane-anchored lipoprotein)